jgi:hypothetical protein
MGLTTRWRRAVLVLAAVVSAAAVFLRTYP